MAEELSNTLKVLVIDDSPAQHTPMVITLNMPPYTSTIKYTPVHDQGLNQLLLELFAKPEGIRRDMIIARAYAQEYSYVHSEYTYPEKTLAAHLRRAGFEDMAAKAEKNGYDH